MTEHNRKEENKMLKRFILAASFSLIGAFCTMVMVLVRWQVIERSDYIMATGIIYILFPFTAINVAYLLWRWARWLFVGGREDA
jgi:membrane protein YdbS with pleckstrin-like domain